MEFGNTPFHKSVQQRNSSSRATHSTKNNVKPWDYFLLGWRVETSNSSGTFRHLRMGTLRCPRSVGNRHNVTSQKNRILSYTALRTSTLVSRNLCLIRNSNPGHAPPPAGSDVKKGGEGTVEPFSISCLHTLPFHSFPIQDVVRDVCRPKGFNYFNESRVATLPQVCR